MACCTAQRKISVSSSIGRAGDTECVAQAETVTALEGCLALSVTTGAVAGIASEGPVRGRVVGLGVSSIDMVGSRGRVEDGKMEREGCTPYRGDVPPAASLGTRYARIRIHVLDRHLPYMVEGHPSRVYLMASPQ